jgi:hypothetical protein
MKTTILAILLAFFSATSFGQSLTEGETYDYLFKYFDTLCSLSSGKVYYGYENGSSDHCYKEYNFGCMNKFTIDGDKIFIHYVILCRSYPCDSRSSSLLGKEYFFYRFKASKIKDIIETSNQNYYKNTQCYKIILEDYSGEKSDSKTNEILLYFNDEEGRTLEKVRKAWLHLASLCKQNYKPAKDPFE